MNKQAYFKMMGLKKEALMSPSRLKELLIPELQQLLKLTIKPQNRALLNRGLSLSLESNHPLQVLGRRLANKVHDINLKGPGEPGSVIFRSRPMKEIEKAVQAGFFRVGPELWSRRTGYHLSPMQKLDTDSIFNRLLSRLSRRLGNQPGIKQGRRATGAAMRGYLRGDRRFVETFSGTPRPIKDATLKKQLDQLAKEMQKHLPE